VSGDTVVAGAPLTDIGSNDNQGAAFVFVELEVTADATRIACKTASSATSRRIRELGVGIGSTSSRLFAALPAG